MTRLAKKPAKKPHGGARAGAGRKPARLPEAVLARIGPPPLETGKRLDANALRTWNAALLAEIMWLSLNGQIGSDLAASIRATAGSLDRALPPAPPARASADDDLDEEAEDVGPDLEDMDPEGDGVEVP